MGQRQQLRWRDLHDSEAESLSMMPPAGVPPYAGKRSSPRPRKHLSLSSSCEKYFRASPSRTALPRLQSLHYAVPRSVGNGDMESSLSDYPCSPANKLLLAVASSSPTEKESSSRSPPPCAKALNYTTNKMFKIVYLGQITHYQHETAKVYV